MPQSITLCPLLVHEAKAWSTMPLRLMVLAPLTAPVAVMTTRLLNEKGVLVGTGPIPSHSTHLQSEMRCARDSALKPANTTLWIAPMRAHASIEIGSSQAIGKYRDTVSPALMP